MVNQKYLKLMKLLKSHHVILPNIKSDVTAYYDISISYFLSVFTTLILKLKIKRSNEIVNFFCWVSGIYMGISTRSRKKIPLNILNCYKITFSFFKTNDSLEVFYNAFQKTIT